MGTNIRDGGVMTEQKLNHIESMLRDLIQIVGTLKVYFEEEKEENQRRFEQIDKRFEQMERRFEQIDKHFEQMERRFEQIDKRFEQVDERFEQMERQFNHVDKRFDEGIGELRVNKTEHDYMATRLFRAEMELDNLKEQLSKK